jgi:RNA polymerase subunit RPABC4/transcription elongation factor Spt4
VTYGTLLGLVVLLVVVGSSGLIGIAAPSRTLVTPAPATAVAPALVPSAVTHGDLVVASGQTFVIQPTLGGRTYFQGGNITVLAGGTLIVENVTLSFVQFVADTGSAQSRLSHVMHFLDEGSVRLYNSTITTDINVLNAYPKLNLTVTGTFTTWGSTLAFPGWVTVEGIGAVLTLNGTLVTNNPGIPGLTEPASILGDSDYAASISAINGAEVNLFNSTVNSTFADNLLLNGLPIIAPLFAQDVAGAVNISDLAGSTSSANLTLDWLNPGPVPAGNVSVWYNTTTGGNGSATVPTTVWYQGVAYPLGSISVLGSTADGYASIPFSPALLAAINAQGLLTYLNNTGLFGGSSQISVAFGGTGAEFSTVRAALIPELQYDLVGSGSTTTINSADSVIDLNWNAPPVTPWSMSDPLPWLSNKLVLTGGATANLANLSVPNAITGVFSTSAVLTDLASTANFYRWASLNLTGQGGIVPIYGATEHAFYAYSGQANNATSTYLNNLPLSNPALWGYVEYRDQQNGFPGYGISGRTGVSTLLLASTTLTGATQPDGNFLGTYHIGLLLPIAQNSSRWFNWSVSPYPVGVAFGSPGYLGPDYGPNQHFPQYFAGAAFQAAPLVTANGTAAPKLGVRIGQVIGFDTVINSTGPAPITSLQALLLWGNSSSHQILAALSTTDIDLSGIGQTYSFTLSWAVNDSITELNGSQSRAFTVVVSWNPGNVTGISGTATLTENVTNLPSQIVISSFSLPPASIQLSGSYYSTGVVHFNGTEAAVIYLYATPTSGGAPILIGSTTAADPPGTFTIIWDPLNQGGESQLSAGTSYTLLAVASYNSAMFNYTLPGVYSVPGSTSPTSFLYETFLGLPLWVWLAIAAGAAVAIVAVLFVLRRQAAGKVVECGECGNLIPEEATVCPKCGAEFESDLVRCSRCASTIPANSVVCPECAAQLLGVPGSAPEEAERQGYQDFTEKYRAEGKKELGENYNEGSFWDWWKRQPTYVSYSQWKLQQGQGAPRMGMNEPPGGPPDVPFSPAPVPTPPRPAAAPKASPPPPPPPLTSSPRATPPSPMAAAPAAAAAGSPPAGGLKACPTCHKEIPGDYLVCPFCGSVTQ